MNATPVTTAAPAAVRDALDEVPFLVSLVVRASEITDRAGVVLPVAPAVEKNGTSITWGGRLRPVGQAREWFGGG